MWCFENIVTLAVFGWLFHLAEGYPSGAPPSSCPDIKPSHKRQNGTIFSPQTGPCPYTIKANSAVYFPGDTLTFEIRTKAADGFGFKGFLALVRQTRSNQRSAFTLPPLGYYDTTNTNVMTTNCAEMRNAVTHNNGDEKFVIDFQWTAPRYLTEDVYLEATVLANFTTYWINVTSDIVKLIRADVLPAEQLEAPWLKEITETAKAKEDKARRRELTLARFNRGFDRALDPEGYMIIQYTVNMLPFNNTDNNTSVLTSAESSGDIHSAIDVLLDLDTATLADTDGTSASGGGPSDYELDRTYQSNDEQESDSINATESLDQQEVNASKTVTDLEPAMQMTTASVAVATTDAAMESEKQRNQGPTDSMWLAAYVRVVKGLLADNVEAVGAVDSYLHALDRST